MAMETPRKPAKAGGKDVVGKAGAKAPRPGTVRTESSARKQSAPLPVPKTAVPRAPGGGVTGAPPVLLAGGNPRIAKGEGNGPVQAYIAAMPGWKRDLGRRLDALIERAVPGVHKAVKWNSPLYGIEGEGWFLGIHCFTKYVKVAFFRGMSLNPVPPGESRSKDTRYLNLREDESFDEKQFLDWVRQASRLPGERM